MTFVPIVSDIKDLTFVNIHDKQIIINFINNCILDAFHNAFDIQVLPENTQNVKSHNKIQIYTTTEDFVKQQINNNFLPFILSDEFKKEIYFVLYLNGNKLLSPLKIHLVYQENINSSFYIVDIKKTKKKVRLLKNYLS